MLDQELAEAIQQICLAVGDDRFRRHRRYMVHGLVNFVLSECRLHQPGGSVTRNRVLVLDVASQEARVVYPGFMHVGSEVSLCVQAEDRSPVDLPGVVTSCTYLCKRYHVAEIRTVAPVPLRELVDAEGLRDMSATDETALAKVGGTALSLTDDEVVGDSVCLHLDHPELCHELTTSKDAAIDALSRGTVDIFVVDGEALSFDAIEVIAEARARLFGGPILVLSRDSEAKFVAQSDTLMRCRSVTVPLTPESLMSALLEIISNHPTCLTSSGPVYPDLVVTEARRELFEKFVARSNEMVEQAELAATASQTDRLVRLLQLFVQTGGSYGFQSVSDLAAAALDAAESGPQNVDQHLKRLKALVRRLRVAPAATDEPPRKRAA